MWRESRTDGDRAEQRESSHSRRSFLKKGIVTAGAVGSVSAVDSASATDTGNTDAVDTGEPAALQDRTQVLVYTIGYQRNLPFRVIGPLQTSNTIQLLTPVRGGEAPEVTQPDDYNGYIIGLFGLGVRTPTFIFSRQNLEVGGVYQFDRNFSAFSPALTLLQTTVRQIQVPNRDA